MNKKYYKYQVVAHIKSSRSYTIAFECDAKDAYKALDTFWTYCIVDYQRKACASVEVKKIEKATTLAENHE